MVMERQVISADGFFDIIDSPGYQDRSLELVEGEIIEMSKPSGLHGQIAMRLGARNQEDLGPSARRKRASFWSASPMAEIRFARWTSHSLAGQALRPYCRITWWMWRRISP